MKTQLISFEGMALETLAEAANEAGEQVEKHAKSAVSIAITAGRALTAAKSQVPHGDWLGWLGKNWNYKQSTANTYMQIANSQHAGNLADAKSIREALRMMSDAKQEAETEIVPRAERKTGRVEVQEVGQAVVHADHFVGVSKMVDENAVKAEPKTNTKHTPVTAKASEADRPAPMTITPVIIEEPFAEIEQKTLADWPVIELLAFLKSSADDPKKRARELRKAADELDPPTKFVKPTIEDVAEYCQERKNNIDAEAFVAHYSANGWKLANGNKLSDWKSAVITWEKRNDSGSQQSGKAIAGTGRIKPGKIDESQIEWR
jgi:hypothetical protein